MNTQVTIDKNLLFQTMQLTNFHSSRELIENALQLMIRSHASQKLSEFLHQSPLVGLDLNLERDKDTGRDFRNYKNDNRTICFRL